MSEFYLRVPLAANTVPFPGGPVGCFDSLFPRLAWLLSLPALRGREPHPELFRLAFE